MKMNIKGLVFVGFAAAVFAGAANAASDKTVTSKTYVDTKYTGDGATITVTDGTGANTGKKVIAVTGDLTPYTAGANVQINDHEISATDTTYNAFDGTANGLVPATGAAADKVLSGDGSWVTVDGTPYTAGTHVTDITNHVINVEGDGTITSGDAKLVTGGTVHSYVGTGTITVNQAGRDAQTFTVNQSGDATITLDNTVYTPGTHVANLTDNAINVEGDGTITSGNDHLVTGGTVYDYLNSASVQSDYAQTDNTKPDFIKNKPTIGAGTITVTQDGQTDQTFTVNDSGNTTISIAAPWTAPTAGTCTDTNPCALVLGTSGTPTWEPIQQ